MTTEAAQSGLQQFSAELASIVARVAPSVVRVDDGSRFTATGLIWTADGVIVTTSHGVERDDDLKIQTADGTFHAATLIGRDSDTDIAVLRVEANDLPAIAHADDNAAQVGHLVLALARPGHLALQATLGIVSSRLETERAGQPEYVLHTDAPLYPGFSGGALVDVSGKLVGLTNLAFGRGKGVALGVPVVASVVQALLTTGRVQRGYLGVRSQLVALPANIKEQTQQETGLLIIQVEADSAAHKGGLLLGDTLLNVDGAPLADVDDLRRALRRLYAGQTANLHLLRGGELRDLPVVLGVEP